MCIRDRSIEFEALVDSIRDVALNIINVSPSMPKEAAFAIKNIDSNPRYADSYPV